MLVAFASVTGPLVNLATHVIGKLGLAGIAVLTMSTGVIGLPGTEPTMLFAGFNVYQGHLTMPGIIAFGLLGDVLGAVIAYTIGYYGRRGLVERGGRGVHVSHRRLDSASSWFERRGAPVILVSRLIPFARAAFPYAAGIAKMPFGRFVALVTLGSILWIAGLGILGREVGRNWQSWRHHLEYADYAVVALVVLAIVYLVLRRIRTPAMDAVSE